MAGMYLKALEIQGFKSFPEKTVLQFGEAITAVVGPNGSGKSNISDAIRWVMGEQSSKNLRGAKMEDVIFGGTEKRSALGFAQVSLVLDNSRAMFPNVEEQEIMITRRYYRSGESEYYINKQSVRLKDINDLLMDTGLGKEGYSIIGQGRIDEILSVKSYERREIFEEAAGISRYRHRKEESQRKLERTEENLVRIRDKIAELSLQIEPLCEQAEKARKFLLLRDELRLLEISVWLLQLEEVRREERKLTGDYRIAKEQLEETNRTLEKCYLQSESFGERLRHNDVEQEDVRNANALLDGQIAQQENAIAVLETSMGHHRESIEALKEELSAQEGRKASLQEQIRRGQQRLEEISIRVKELENTLEELLQQVCKAENLAGNTSDDVRQLREKETSIAEKMADTKAELSALNASFAQMEERYHELQSEEVIRKQEEQEAAVSFEAAASSLKDAEEKAVSVRNVVGGYLLKLQTCEQRDEALQKKVMELTMAHNALLSRQKLLSEMEQEYEGFHKAVRLVMQAAQSHTLTGIHGPVASLITTEDAYAVAIEIALGAGLQNIVVDREEDAKKAIQYLKQRDGGRATFLPIRAIRGDILREPGLSQETGFIGIANTLVSFAPAYRSIFENLLGRTVIVEDLDCGISMARKYQNRFRIVTLDGQVLNRGGSMTGGSVSRTAGILSRAGELRRVIEEQKKVEQTLQKTREEAHGATREREAAQYSLTVVREEQRQAEDLVLTRLGQQNQQQTQLQAVQELLKRLYSEGETLVRKREEIRKSRKEKEVLLSTFEREMLHYQREAMRLLAGQTDLLEQSAGLREEVTAIKTQLAALAAERDAVNRSTKEVSLLLQQLQGDGIGREQRIFGYENSIKEAEGEIAARRKHMERLHREKALLSEKLKSLGEERLQIDKERTTADRELRTINDTVLHMQQEISRIEQKKATNAMEEGQIIDRLWEHYELSHSAAQEQAIDIESVPKANRRIGELKKEMSKLGTINLGAIEEYDRVNTRYTYLTDQQNDVEKAKGELLHIIEELTREMTGIFAQQFSLIKEAFETTFLALFGGGKATLELEDTGDILNCGIEIKVQPPGKALKTITLLSGGEKAFVAIALYFAILKVHPTPFCVMDEIEAALDEANVQRFARYMRSLTANTQFIVITHRRGTMEEADVLYGVTMQEKGVSRMLTMNLQELSKEFHIE